MTAGPERTPEDAVRDQEPGEAPEATEVEVAAQAADATPAGETPPAGAGDGAADAAEGDYRDEDAILDEMKGTIAELTGDLQRLQAEYLNYKRRVDRDRDLVLQNAKVNVLNALLPVLDDIDRAREHEELTGGFRAVAEGVERVVTGAGLVKFGAPGDEFDPRLHEAMAHSYADPADGVTTTTCQYVVQAGYQYGERVVRPAKVMVVDPAPGAEPGGSDDAAAPTSSTEDASGEAGTS